MSARPPAASTLLRWCCQKASSCRPAAFCKRPCCTPAAHCFACTQCMTQPFEQLTSFQLRSWLQQCCATYVDEVVTFSGSCLKTVCDVLPVVCVSALKVEAEPADICFSRCMVVGWAAPAPALAVAAGLSLNMRLLRAPPGCGQRSSCAACFRSSNACCVSVLFVLPPRRAATA